jgi:hypothetical protein
MAVRPTRCATGVSMRLSCQLGVCRGYDMQHRASSRGSLAGGGGIIIPVRCRGPSPDATAAKCHYGPCTFRHHFFTRPGPGPRVGAGSGRSGDPGWDNCLSAVSTPPARACQTAIARVGSVNLKLRRLLHSFFDFQLVLGRSCTGGGVLNKASWNLTWNASCTGRRNREF